MLTAHMLTALGVMIWQWNAGSNPATHDDQSLQVCQSDMSCGVGQGGDSKARLPSISASLMHHHGKLARLQ